MKKINLYMFFFIVLTLNSISNETKSIKINFKNLIDSKLSNEFIEVGVLPKGQYQLNAFYVKFKNKCDEFRVREILISNFIQNELSDFEINSISQPFQIEIPKDKIDIGLKNIFLVEYNSKVDIYDICRNLNSDIEIEYASPIFARYLTETPNDTRISEQYLLNKIQAFQAWDITKGDSSIVIGMVDSGFDILHNDLKDKVFTNQKEIPNDNIDNDKNGFIDDIYGWDFIGNIGWEDADINKWKPDNDVIPNSTSNTHGTHVAGIAAANTNNALGVAGIAPNCKFLPVKCALDNMDGKTGGSNRIYRGFEAISYAASLGCKVISCSWSGEGFSPVEQDIVNQLTELGVVIVAAAGNDGVLLDRVKLFPASYHNVIAVGASEQSDQKLSYSQYGLGVAVYAPGSGVLSTTPGNSYSTKSGTSMSTPVVSGAIALLKSLNNKLSFKEIYHQVRSTSDNVLTQEPNLRPFYYGRLNLFKMLSYNNPNFAGKSAPGISVDNFKVNDTTFLDGNEASSLKLVFKNYLSKATNINILISEFDGYVTIKNNYFTVNYLDKGDSILVTPIIQLSNNNPWYKGYARFMIYYKGDNNYTDYELIEIPINIETTNKSIVAQKFPVYHDIVWKKAISKSDYNFMSVGYYNETGNGIYYSFLDQIPFQLLGNDTLSALDKFGSKTIFLGTKPPLGTAKVYKSFNNGANWVAQSITGLTSVNHIQFQDSLTCWIFGETGGGTFGVAKSQNAGASWIVLDNLPNKLQLSGLGIEKMSENSIKIKDNLLIFGTNYGRTVSSYDYGKNWVVSAVSDTLPSYFMDFSTLQNGIQIFKNMKSDEFSLKYTTDEGKNWLKSDYSFQNQNLIPLYIYAPDSSKMFTMLCRAGEVLSTIDMGKTWKNELTDEYFFNNIQTGAGITTSKGVRLWNSGYDFTYLDFNKVPLLEIKKLTSLSPIVINFDTVFYKKNRDTIIFIQNKGNVSLKISQIVISGQNFSIDTNFKKTILPNEIVSINVNFSGQIKGLNQGKLIIKSDSELGDLTFDFYALVVDPVSISEETRNQLSCKFNNTSKSIEVTTEKPLSDFRYEIIDLAGNIILKNNHIDFSNNTNYFIPFESNCGIFFIKIYSYGMNFTSKFMIID